MLDSRTRPTILCPFSDTYLACNDPNSCKVGTGSTGCPDWNVPCNGAIVFSEDPAEPGVLQACIQAPGANNCSDRRRQRQRTVLASAQQGTTPSVGAEAVVGGSMRDARSKVADPSSTSGPAGRLLRGATA